MAKVGESGYFSTQVARAPTESTIGAKERELGAPFAPIPDEFKVIPDDLAICAPPPSETEREVAVKIRNEFLIEGEPEPYVDDFIRAFRPLKGGKTYLEVGIFDRGNLAYLSELLAEDALLIGVDVQADHERDALLRSRLKSGQRYFFVEGDSRRPEVAAAVSEILSGRPLDAVFIDGDHTAYGVMCDFVNYRPLVRPGGLVMFHDCLWEGDATFKGVCDALAEIDKFAPVYLVPGRGDCRRFMRPLFRDQIWGVVGICRSRAEPAEDSAALRRGEGDSADAPAPALDDEFARRLALSDRSLEYFLRENTPWRRVALRHPIKIGRWLMLREFQIAKRRLR